MKGVLKVSKEQVIETERYCDEHGITRKRRIDELGLSRTAYYYTRGLLSEEELHGGQFIPIMSDSGLMQTASIPVGRSRRKQASVQTELMTIEVRTSSEVEMLLSGEWKKSHPESHSMVHHTTEAEHVVVILKSRAKRKEAEGEASKEESK